MALPQITTLDHIRALLVDGYDSWKEHGEVYVKHSADLTLFCYLPSAAFTEEWTFLETVARGLVINNQTGDIVARPYDKFFNYGQGNRYTSASPREASMKMDGSLGIFYTYQDQVKVCTKGSLSSDQAVWATDYINSVQFSPDHIRNIKEIQDEHTILSEIIYPSNRIVVDYGDFKGLTVLDIRHRETGEYIPHDSDVFTNLLSTCNLIPVEPVRVHSIEEIDRYVQSEKDSLEEGLVVLFEDGQRFKFKNSRYLELHRLISNITYKNILNAMLEDNLAEFKEEIPDEFIKDLELIEDDITRQHDSIMRQIDLAWCSADKPDPVDRKAFALWVIKNHKPVSKYLFLLADGNIDRIRSTILKTDVVQPEDNG